MQTVSVTPLLLRSLAASSLLLVLPVLAQQAAPNERSVPAGTSSDDREFLEPITPAVAARIDELIQSLGSPRHAERSLAAEQLLELGVAPFPKLRHAFHETSDFEVRSRIQDVVRRGYLEFHVLGNFGFLGISQGPVVTHDDFPLIPEGQAGITIRRVIEDTGAARAGMQEGDIVLEVDHEPIRKFGSAAINWFGTRIRERGPGATMELLVLRGDTVRTISAVLMRPPEDLVRDPDRPLLHIAVLTARAEMSFPAWWLKHFGPIENES